MRGFFKRINKSETSSRADQDEDFHDTSEVQLVQARLHPEAHDEGGYAFTDKVLLAQQRGVVTEVIKEMGKKLLSGHLNLVNVTLPVKMFEPRSYLEKLTDNWVYPQYLTEAAHATDPITRMELVMTWYVSGLQHSFQSWRKPFNPILGETFQANLSDGSTVAMEQISHHPPISAFQLVGPDELYTFSGSSQPDVSFELKGNAVKTSAKGLRRLVFKNDGTAIEIMYPTYHMRGLLYTAMPRGDMTGSATFLDRKNNLLGEVLFGKVAGQEHEPLLQRSDAVSVNIHEVTCMPRESDADEPLPIDNSRSSKRSLSGITGGITSILHRGDTQPANVTTVPAIKGRLCSTGQGNWLAYLDWNSVRQWTLENESAATWEKPAYLLPSDSRFRKDLTALQEGDLAKAQAAKEELEGKQRQNAKLRKGGVESAASLSFRSLSLGR